MVILKILLGQTKPKCKTFLAVIETTFQNFTNLKLAMHFTTAILHAYLKTVLTSLWHKPMKKYSSMDTVGSDQIALVILEERLFAAIIKSP